MRPATQPCDACSGNGIVPHTKRKMENNEIDPADFRTHEICVDIVTPAQQLALDLINKLNREAFLGWFEPSAVMAFVQVESAFRPRAFRQEPSGVASYGLMQILDVTARGIGFNGAFEELYDPETGLLWGMKYARQIWDLLQRSLGRPPTLVEWCSAYNEGPGNVLRGRDDSAYARPWMAAKVHWEPLVDTPQAPAPVPVPAPVPQVDIHTLVVMLQQALNAQTGSTLSVDGIFGPRTYAVLATWQNRKV